MNNLHVHRFNHSQEYQTHIEVPGQFVTLLVLFLTRFDQQSDYDVCSLCGSVGECVHDRDDIPPTESSDRPVNRREKKLELDMDTCDMVLNAPIMPFQEIFNTYGEHLSNAQLLAHYGFLLDSNENDMISWNMAELSSRSGENRNIDTNLFMEILSAWGDFDTLWANSHLVYTPRRGDNDSDNAGQHRDSVEKRRDITLCVNDEGKISHHLWLFCALLNMDSSRTTTVPDSLKLLRQLVDRQNLLESLNTNLEDRDGEGFPLSSGKLIPDTAHMPAASTPLSVHHLSQSGAAQILRDSAQYTDSTLGGCNEAALLARLGYHTSLTVTQVCKSRIGCMIGPELSGAELGDLADVRTTISRHPATSWT